MQLILTYWDPKSGPLVAATEPKLPDTSAIGNITGDIMKIQKPNACFEEIIPAEEGNFVNYMFQIKSDWQEEKCETLMITGILDEHENPNIFKKAFNELVKKFKSTPEIYKGFYIKSSKTDPKIPAMIPIIQNLLKEAQIAIQKQLDTSKSSLANIILLGIQAVGKTTIITRLISGNFNNQIRPTLAPQILKLLFEQIDFRVYDVGGQVSLRHRWQTVLTLPQGIIFVIDATHDKDLQDDEMKEFARMMTHYFQNPGGKNLSNSTPVLILINKADLKPDLKPETIEAMLEPKKYGINYKLGLCSALTGEGLLENLQWFAKEMKVTRR